MTDRELLEAAARAAGLTGDWSVQRCSRKSGVNTPIEGFFIRNARGGYGKLWTPLTDDGDALRLAVKLRLDIFNYYPPEFEQDSVRASHMLGSEYGSAEEEAGTDPYAATRRAIVRAAAAIGAA